MSAYAINDVVLVKLPTGKYHAIGCYHAPKAKWCVHNEIVCRSHSQYPLVVSRYVVSDYESGELAEPAKAFIGFMDAIDYARQLEEKAHEEMRNVPGQEISQEGQG